MAVPFDDLNPYEELGVEVTCSPSEIKKLYYKLCLKYHPDKLSESDKEDEELIAKFQKIQFSYTFLSDTVKRKRYDQTGSLEESGADEDFNWKDYFDGIKMDEITPEKIEQDKKHYQNSLEEEEDLIQMYQYYDGEFIKLFESIPHSELEIDEPRFFDKVEELILQKKLDKTKLFTKYKTSRSKIKLKLLKLLAKEAKELEELRQLLNIGKKPDSLDDLSLMIQNRSKKRAAQADDFFDRLAAKYSEPKLKKNKKPKK